MIFSERTIMKPDASRPNVAHLLEPNGWVSGIGLEKLEGLVGELTDWLWQLAMVNPELR
jgi:hypothetical protein